MDLTTEQVKDMARYVIHRERALDRDLLPYGDPTGKDIMVFGGGYGNDVLWAARHGANSILNLDLSPISEEPLRAAMSELGITHERIEFRCENIHDTALGRETFDLIVSNGVFEHIHDLKGVLEAFRPLLRARGRIAIFADGLWYSSIGGHAGKGPWEHLYRERAELKAEVSPERWNVMCNRLNRMTLTDFIEAIRAVGLVILKLDTRRDPNLAQLQELLPAIQKSITASPTDLSVVAIGCELCFPEHL